MYGALKPARLPTVLISAMPAAAAAPVRNWVGQRPEVRQRGEDRHGGDRDDRDRWRPGELAKSATRDAEAADEGGDGDVPGLEAATRRRHATRSTGRARPARRGSAVMRPFWNRSNSVPNCSWKPSMIVGRKKREGVEAVDEAEVDERRASRRGRCLNADARPRACRRGAAPVLVAASLARARSVSQTCSSFVEPLRVGRLVLEVEPGDDADDDRGDRDAEEHEAPALEAEEDAVVARSASPASGAPITRGEGLRQVEEREDLAAVAGGHPEAQEEDRAGEEPGLGDAEQEAQARRAARSSAPR